MATLEITTRIGCSNMCVYCPQKLLLDSYALRNAEADKYVMSFEDFKTCIGKVPKNVHIHFTGFAEPFLNPDCMEMAEYADKAGYPIHIYTTLMGMHPSDMHKISLMKNLVGLVVHLPSRQNDTKIVVDGKYLNNLESACERIKPLEFVYFGELDDRIKGIVGGGAYLKDKATLHDRAGTLSEDKLVGFNSVSKQERKKGVITCYSCGNKLDHNILLPNGDVVLCCMDYGMKHVIGNLLTDDYVSLFQSKEYKRVKSGLSNPNEDIICRDCFNSIERKGVWGWIRYLNAVRKEWI